MTQGQNKYKIAIAKIGYVGLNNGLFLCNSSKYIN